MKSARKTFTLLVLALTVADPAAHAVAGSGHRNGGHHAGGHRLHGVPRAYVVPYASGFYRPFYPYSFYPNSFFPNSLYPYFYPYYPPRVSLPPAPTENNQNVPQSTPGLRYFCGSADAYYPDIGECAEEWQQVAPQAQ